ncbi:MAG: flagellar basal-body rod protein FlgC [Candidatus Paceibacteria bacterium]|jgi:flagellar basal-body rod protein FlgC
MDSIRALFSGFRATASGMSAERIRMDVISKNLANSNTTRMPGEGPAQPYRRQVVHFAPILAELQGGGTEIRGVRVSEISGDTLTPFDEIYEPTHPDADGKGMVRRPNVNTMKEMADLMTAVRSYEANLKAQDTFVKMAERALRLAQ